MNARTMNSFSRERRWPIGESLALGELVHWSVLGSDEGPIAGGQADRVTAEWAWDQLDQWARWEIARAIGLSDGRLSDDAEVFEAYIRAVSDGAIAYVRRDGLGQDSRSTPTWYSSPRSHLVEDLSESPAKAAPEPMTWFAIEVIDDAGQALAGIDLIFDVEGTDQQTIATGGDGVARRSGVRGAGGGAARFADTDAAWRALVERWQSDRQADPISPPADSISVEIGPGLGTSSVRLKAEVQQTIILARPYRVRLTNHDGTARGGLSCSISVGGRRYQSTADLNGWIAFPAPPSCPAKATIEWNDGQETRMVDVALLCHDGDPQAIARARLFNLGYLVHDDDLPRGVAKFQAHFDLPPEEVDESGVIPDATVDKIDQVWSRRHG